MAIYNVTYQSVQKSTDSPLNAIYIDASPVAGDLLHIEVTSIPSAQPIALQGQGSASAQNYHFTVSFQPGDLSHPNDIALAADQVNDWDLFETNSPSGTMFYVLRKGTLTLAPGTSFTVTLQKVGAQAKRGPRTTSVQFTWAADIMQRDPQGLGPLLSSGIEIINFERTYTPPLSVGFDTTNMVLSDGSFQNALVLRIVNVGKFPIGLDPEQCRFTLLFDTSTDVDQRWALATPNQAKAFFVPGKLDSSGEDKEWAGYGSWIVGSTADPVEWQITPTGTNTALAVGASLEIPISNIVTGHPTGRALLRVQYQGLEGYDDGQVTVEVQKTPLLYSQGDRAVQIRGQSFGLSHVNGAAELATLVDGTGGGLGTFSSHPLQLYADAKPRLTLTTDGKLGVGTSSPAAMLDVRGDAAVSGTLGFGQQTRQMLGLFGSEYGVGVQSSTTYFRSNGNFGFYRGGVHSDAELDPGAGGSAMMVIKSGSVGIGTTEPQATLDVSGDAIVSGDALVTGALGFGYERNLRQMIDLWDSDYGIGVQEETLYLRSDCDFAFFSGGEHSDVALDPGDGGRVPVVIKRDGKVLINGQPPMAVKQYSGSGDAQKIDTGWSTTDWFACIVGFNVMGQNSTTGLYVGAEDVGGTWSLSPFLYDASDMEWVVLVLFVRKELCTW